MTRERLYLFDTTLRDGALTTGVDFSLEDKRQIAAMLDRLGVDYVEGGYPGANPTRHAILRTQADQARPLLRLRHDQARRPLGRQRSRPRRAHRRRRGRHRLRRQDLGLSRPCRARLHARGKPRLHRRQRESGARRGARGDGRLRAFLRRLQGQSRLRARMRARRLSFGRPLGRALRHQRRHASRRGRAHRRRSRARHPGRPSRHSRPQRHRQRGRQFAGGGARRRAPDAGHAERTWRTLRQRQSRLADPDAGAEARSRRAIRDRRLRRVAARDCQDLARLRRTAESGAGPARALCRRLRLRDQGGHSRLRPGQGPAHLRARAAGKRRQRARDSGLRSGGTVQSDRAAHAHGDRGAAPTIPGSPGCSTR